MCRSTDYDRFISVNRDRLKIRSFVVRLSGLRPTRDPLPQSLTVIYLPRIDENELEVSGSKIRPDSPAFVSLHRGVSGSGEAAFVSRDRVVASDGARFEVYLREERVLKGIFRRREEGEREWGLELGCVMETEIDGVDSAAAAVEVGVTAEGHVTVCERVEMRVKRRAVLRRRRFEGLEEIPEEREEVLESLECECGGCDCGGVGSDGGDLKMEMDGGDEMNVEGVGWVVDVGIWVMCLGVGFLVSKASSKTLRRRRIL